jgi:methylated-DNA-protein-cysteine methyltransferase-like protein
MARPSAWEEIYRMVRRIPRGRVMSYGQISQLLKRPLSARAVGWAMNQCPDDVPWQRVVNAAGGISTEHRSVPRDLQRRLLEAEGIRFGADGKLSMSKYRFVPKRRSKAK